MTPFLLVPLAIPSFLPVLSLYIPCARYLSMRGTSLSGRLLQCEKFEFYVSLNVYQARGYYRGGPLDLLGYRYSKSQWIDSRSRAEDFVNEIYTSVEEAEKNGRT